MHYDVDENLWPNSQDRVDSAVRNTPVDILLYAIFFYLFVSNLKFKNCCDLIISAIIFQFV